MKLQRTYVREGVTMPLGQTYQIDLPKTGMLSSLLLKVQGSTVSGASAADPKWRLIDFLTLIEVIGNGSTVIKSFLAKSCQYEEFLRTGVVPTHKWRNYATNTQMEFIHLLFGRSIGDTDYGLDLSMWNSVTLKITNIGSATFYGADLSLSMLATYLINPSGGFKGYLRTETFQEWTTVADATNYLILPSEYPIAGIFLRALPDVTTGMQKTGFAIDFTIGGGQTQLYEGGLDDLLIENRQEQGLNVLTAGEAYVTADKGIATGIGNMFGWSGIAGSHAGVVSTVVPTMLGDATDGTVSFEAYTADVPIEFMAMGNGYHQHAYLHFNKGLDPNFMVDPKVDGEVRLNIHTKNDANAAGGTNDVILERLVS
jgi:hypothetical protein